MQSSGSVGQGENILSAETSFRQIEKWVLADSYMVLVPHWILSINNTDTYPEIDKVTVLPIIPMKVPHHNRKVRKKSYVRAKE